MATESDADTSRVSVRTYIPAYQRDEWDEHAEELDMSRSEYVRSMVQAGRRGFEEFVDTVDTEEGASSPDAAEAGTDVAQDDDLESVVVETLSDGEHLSWDELLEAVTDDIEGRLEDTLQRLQDQNRVRYSGRHGGYTLDE